LPNAEAGDPDQPDIVPVTSLHPRRAASGRKW